MDNVLQILVQITAKIKAYLEGVQWLPSIILIFRRKGKKDHEFKAIFSYVMTLCLFFFLSTPIIHMTSLEKDIWKLRLYPRSLVLFL